MLFQHISGGYHFKKKYRHILQIALVSEATTHASEVTIHASEATIHASEVSGWGVVVLSFLGRHHPALYKNKWLDIKKQFITNPFKRRPCASKMCASERVRVISDQLFVTLYTLSIYLFLCTQTSDPISSGPVSRHKLLLLYICISCWGFLKMFLWMDYITFLVRAFGINCMTLNLIYKD